MEGQSEHTEDQDNKQILRSICALDLEGNL